MILLTKMQKFDLIVIGGGSGLDVATSGSNMAWR